MPDATTLNTWEYDDLNRVTKHTDAEDMETLYSYDAAGNVTSVQQVDDPYATPPARPLSKGAKMAMLVVAAAKADYATPDRTDVSPHKAAGWGIAIFGTYILVNVADWIFAESEHRAIEEIQRDIEEMENRLESIQRDSLEQIKGPGIGEGYIVKKTMEQLTRLYEELADATAAGGE